jgi:hypothetical protein
MSQIAGDATCSIAGALLGSFSAATQVVVRHRETPDVLASLDPSSASSWQKSRWEGLGTASGSSTEVAPGPPFKLRLGRQRGHGPAKLGP